VITDGDGQGYLCKHFSILRAAFRAVLQRLRFADP